MIARGPGLTFLSQAQRIKVTEVGEPSCRVPSAVTTTGATEDWGLLILMKARSSIEHDPLYTFSFLGEVRA
jgi:hypothetical protein